MKMNKKFIQLYDCQGRIYIVNINKISAIDVDMSKVWVGEALLDADDTCDDCEPLVVADD